MGRRGREEELLLEIARLRERVGELESERVRSLQLDPVTGILNPRSFRERVFEEMSRSRRYRHPLSLAVIALDDFASLELAHGFSAGDAVLVAVSQRLTRSTRTHDLLGRSGPSEFGLLLPETGVEGATELLERLLVELEALGGDAQHAVGVSIGVASLQNGGNAEGLLSGARQACGEAARGGGGRVVIAGRAGAGEEDVRAPQRDAVEALALALLERDRYTGEHSQAVIEMSSAVARSLGCSAQEVERVRSAALLHDIGKVAIPDEILHKPGPLSASEWLLMREHPVIGERILRVLPGMGRVARIVRHEHERWDGDGYPDGLTGDEIPLGSRIVIAADTYHAITSHRPYRPAASHHEAVQELTRCAGTQFDPDVTQALIGHLYSQRQGGIRAA